MMPFRAWRSWVLSLPWSLRWFIYLMLLRPLVDNLYGLKEVSPFLSPLYLIGVLTPVAIVASFLSARFPSCKAVGLDYAFGVWGALLLLNVVAVASTEISLVTAEIMIKLITPVLIYFFVRHLVRSKTDLIGVLTTFLYSCIFPFAVLLFENVFSPIAATAGRGDLERLRGGYADVVAYAAFITGALLVSAYLFSDKSSWKSPTKKLIFFVTVVGVCLIGLLSIHHAASWAVVAMLVVLMTFFSATGKKIRSVLVILFLGGCVAYVAGDVISDRVTTLYGVDMEVIEGTKGDERALHGRVGRWKRMIGEWEEMSLPARMFGISLDPDAPRSMLLVGPHNDYLRVLFATGIVGLLAYLTAYVLLLFRSLTLSRNDQFLLFGAMCVILMYSLTITPTVYVRMMYLYFPIIAYAALPKKATPRPQAAPRGVNPGRSSTRFKSRGPKGRRLPRTATR